MPVTVNDSVAKFNAFFITISEQSCGWKRSQSAEEKNIIEQTSRSGDVQGADVAQRPG